MGLVMATFILEEDAHSHSFMHIIREAVGDDTWLDGEFVETVQQRGAAIIKVGKYDEDRMHRVTIMGLLP